MEIHVAGVSFRSAPLVVREEVALTEELGTRLLHNLREEALFQEAMVLNTCNRTEFYVVADGEQFSAAPLLEHIAKVKGKDGRPRREGIYIYSGQEAVRHIFRVASSLDSQLVGEHEIIGQVKSAYHRAYDARTAGVVLNRLMHWAFRVAKDVQTHTKLGYGPTSVPGAAVELARRSLGTLHDKTVILLGAGQAGELAAHALARSGANRVIVANRTLSKAEQLAEQLRGELHASADDAGAGREPQVPAGARLARQRAGPHRGTEVRAVGLQETAEFLRQADLIISSTGGQAPFLTRSLLASIAQAKPHPLMIMDVAMPRSVDPQVAQMPNVVLHNIDDINQLVTENLSRRKLEIPRAEAIVNEHAAQFGQWMESLAVVPTIKLLQERIEGVLLAEVQDHKRQFAQCDHEQLELFARHLCNRIIHNPIAFLHNSVNGDPMRADPAVVDLVRQIFDLDSTEDKA